MDILAEIVKVLTPQEVESIQRGRTSKHQEVALLRAILNNPVAFRVYAHYSFQVTFNGTGRRQRE